MTDLEALNAELARQDKEFDACFEQMKGIDKDVLFAMPEETLEQLKTISTATPTKPALPPTWSVRG